MLPQTRKMESIKLLALVAVAQIAFHGHAANGVTGLTLRRAIPLLRRVHSSPQFVTNPFPFAGKSFGFAAGSLDQIEREGFVKTQGSLDQIKTNVAAGSPDQTKTNLITTEGISENATPSTSSVDPIITKGTDGSRPTRIAALAASMAAEVATTAAHAADAAAEGARSEVTRAAEKAEADPLTKLTAEITSHDPRIASEVDDLHKLYQKMYSKVARWEVDGPGMRWSLDVLRRKSNDTDKVRKQEARVLKLVEKIEQKRRSLKSIGWVLLPTGQSASEKWEDELHATIRDHARREAAHDWECDTDYVDATWAMIVYNARIDRGEDPSESPVDMF